ncbi:hypothetical protein NDU88_002272 [Pleurodeles waltl]|uniref:Uncharacterized protein n=1 Tax=Pleurodeles waltl TaxID=8319 RepID=A0AAV7NI47_PLEWA|nr:hypothetical protein NDU88_002272 [Pleurodeles waltl]
MFRVSRRTRNFSEFSLPPYGCFSTSSACHCGRVGCTTSVGSPGPPVLRRGCRPFHPRRPLAPAATQTRESPLERCVSLPDPRVPDSRGAGCREDPVRQWYCFQAGGLGCRSLAQAVLASSVAARFVAAVPTAPLLRTWGAQSLPQRPPGRTQWLRPRRPHQQASPQPRVWQDATGRSAILILILSLRSRLAPAARSVLMPASEGPREFRSPWEHPG